VNVQVPYRFIAATGVTGEITSLIDCVTVYETERIEIRFAFYCRVAHTDECAIELQEKTLINFAKDIGEHLFYRDNGAGRLTLDRPEMNRLIADIRDGCIRFVNFLS